MGISTGVYLSRLVKATNEISKLVGRSPVSRVAAAMNAKVRAASRRQ
jgi:hydroxymethylglutaryl-CoA lyase